MGSIAEKRPLLKWSGKCVLWRFSHMVVFYCQSVWQAIKTLNLTLRMASRFHLSGLSKSPAILYSCFGPGHNLQKARSVQLFLSDWAFSCYCNAQFKGVPYFKEVPYFKTMSSSTSKRHRGGGMRIRMRKKDFTCSAIPLDWKIVLESVLLIYFLRKIRPN
jgi:hypothetical protein